MTDWILIVGGTLVVFVGVYTSARAGSMRRDCVSSQPEPSYASVTETDASAQAPEASS